MVLRGSSKKGAAKTSEDLASDALAGARPDVLSSKRRVGTVFSWFLKHFSHLPGEEYARNAIKLIVKILVDLSSPAKYFPRIHDVERIERMLDGAHEGNRAIAGFGLEEALLMQPNAVFAGAGAA